MAIQEQGNKTSSRLSLLIHEISNNPPLIAKIKQDPEREIRNLMATILMDHPAPITPKEDRFTFRLCVIILEIIILSVVGLVGFKYCTMLPTDGPLYVPEILVAIGSTALGALAGLLAPQASREK